MTYARLDYPAEKLAIIGRDKIVMESNTEIERAMRISACEKEPWTVDFIESFSEGECLWDIGACVGSYTLLAAARKLEVVAFEPVSENYATLVRNLAINEMLASVLTIPLALGDQDALIWQHRSDMRSGAASHQLSGSGTKRALHQQLIPLIRADTARVLWGLATPHGIKIDVDGFEPQVLVGAETLLQEPQLRAILIELQTANDAALIAWLKERGWTIEEQYPERGGIYYAKLTRTSQP